MAVTEASLDELRGWQNIDTRHIATLAAEQVQAELKTSASGLSNTDAAARLQVIGYGSFAFRGGWRRSLQLLAILVRPLLLPLWVGAIIAFSIDRDLSGQALLLAAALNTIVAAVQERKSERATAALHDLLPAYSRVLRNGEEQHLMSSMLVPGDVLLLQPNDIVPADARLIEATDLHTVNPALRSADDVAHKTAAPIDEPLQATDLPNVVYAGARVVSGHGRAVVFATGLRSAFGQIATLTQSAQEEQSPLLLAFARLGSVVVIVATAGAVLGYLYATMRLGMTTAEGLNIAVLFLTAAVPVGLMPSITLTLLEGAQRLQQRKAIFRRLSNVETLGATTVICTDKTGTLTQNEMTVRELWTTEGIVTVTGVGYQPNGEFINDQHRSLDHITAQKQAGPLLRAALLTSTARLLPPDTLKPRWHILGDPVEAAQLVAAAKIDVRAEQLYEQNPQLAVLNSDRRAPLDAVIVEEHGHPVAFVKGAPVDLLQHCASIWTPTGERPMTDRDRQTIRRTIQRWQREAMRTIAFARRSLAPEQITTLEIDDLKHDLVFLGMIGANDPPRQEVATAIKACHNAKIRTIMLTGDDTIGAASLARRCQLVHGAQPLVISGPEIESMDDATLRERLGKGDMVLARLTPENKVRVVRALEALGEVVLVTGSAASDVPALKAAYTGIAMGATGSPAARQAADLVFLDDNFATIAVAIAEGRAVEQRVRRLVALNLATTVVKLGALLASLFFGLPLLLTVGQQLLIDFLAGLLPGLAIGAGRPDPRLMQRPPRPTGRPLLARKVYVLGYALFGSVATLIALLTTALYMSLARTASGRFTAAELFRSNLAPYAERALSEAGQRGLVATSLYVVISVAAILGVALIRRSGAADDRRPRYLLLGLVALSFAILITIIEIDVFHPFIAFTAIPVWAWFAAFAVTAATAGLELTRQRLDPIFPQAAAAAPKLRKVGPKKERAHQ